MESDNCTFAPEGSWTKCCKRHDRRYRNKRLTRLQADILLKRCVKRKSGSTLIANIFFIGVRLFGWYFYNKATNPKKI